MAAAAWARDDTLLPLLLKLLHLFLTKDEEAVRTNMTFFPM